ncbi:MAG: hypothetical protein JSV31_01595, partial [Desulfobacterales bacterium]
FTMGSFIVYLKVQPFIATLAGMWFARGMCFFISDNAINIDNRLFKKRFGLPLPYFLSRLVGDFHQGDDILFAKSA